MCSNNLLWYVQQLNIYNAVLQIQWHTGRGAGSRSPPVKIFGRYQKLEEGAKNCMYINLVLYSALANSWEEDPGSGWSRGRLNYFVLGKWWSKETRFI